MINVTKLHQELLKAGIPIVGVADSTPPRIDFLPEATPAQMQQAQTVLAAHVPEDYADKRQKEYLENGLTSDKLIFALWDQIIDGDTTEVQRIKAIRATIKAKYPKP